MRKLLSILTLGCSAVQLTAADRTAQLGTWREGYKAAYGESHKFTNWDALWDWAEAGGKASVLPLRMAQSTDRAGGRHSYIDTRSGGHREACLAILEEMRFIGSHNSGDTKNFFRIMLDWMKMQDLDRHIPLGR